MQKTHIWIQIQPGLAGKDCEELPKCRSGRTMTSGLILSTNFTDTTKHRWCFLGASSADLNKQIKTHQKVRKTLTQLKRTTKSIEFVDLHSLRMSEMTCLKDQERSCNYTSISIISADTVTKAMEQFSKTSCGKLQHHQEFQHLLPLVPTRRHN